MKSKYSKLWPVAAVAAAGGLFACSSYDGSMMGSPVGSVDKAVNNIDNVVVIYAENRSFDNLYSDFPGIDSPLAKATFAPQLDRDGKTVLPTLPKVWGGVTAPAASQFDKRVPNVGEADTAGMPNAPFSINQTYNVELNAVNRDLWHNFYQNQMQIDGGKNDMFAAWADSGGMVMGYFTGDADKLPLWKVARKYTLADHFFMGAFGGSFLNHQYLIASAPPVDPVNKSNQSLVAALDDGPQGYRLTVKKADPTSLPTPMKTLSVSATGIFVNGGNITPDGYAINTMQPPYQPSSNAPAAGATGAAKLLADASKPNTLPPQSQANIGDYLSAKNVDWAWYGGGWGFQAARAANPAGWQGSDYVGGQALLKDGAAVANFQFHHQPFNYFTRFDPTTASGQAERAAHLKDAGLQGEKFLADARAGKLPPVSFYKPVGNLNEHNGYADVQRGDQHIVDLISTLEKSPQWAHMLVIVTYDENGGLWDHVAPPKGDRFGPGSRIPTLIVGPTVRKGYVDHTMYDTTSILRFITRRWSLPVLPGLQTRIDALKANSGVEEGDLSQALLPSAS